MFIKLISYPSNHVVSACVHGATLDIALQNTRNFRGITYGANAAGMLGPQYYSRDILVRPRCKAYRGFLGSGANMGQLTIEKLEYAVARLARIVAYRDLTQTQLEQLSGVKQPTISKILSHSKADDD